MVGNHKRQHSPHTIAQGRDTHCRSCCFASCLVPITFLQCSQIQVVSYTAIKASFTAAVKMCAAHEDQM